MKPKGIFINISKTGGTSISRMIIEALPAGSVVTEYGPDVQYDGFGHVCEESFLSHIAGLPSRNLDMVQAFVGHLPLISRDKLPFPARYVMVLRDPVARLISAHSYSMRGKILYNDFYNFGLHLSATYIGSDSWENPISKFLLKKDHVGHADLNALKDIVSDFDIVGTTEDMDGLCHSIFSEFEWEMPEKIQRLNETFSMPVESLAAETVRAINNRNTIDRFLYKHVSGHPVDAILREIDNEPQGAFSSGDYHQQLASDFAFLKYGSRPWHSSAALLKSSIEYIGYDFGTPRPVTEIWLQLAMRQGSILRFAVEASSDRFVDDIRHICVVEATSAAQEGQVLRIAPVVEARSWRLRRLSPLTDEALSVAGLAFGDQPRPAAKNISRCMDKIAEIRRAYNIETYTRALSEA